MINTIESEDPSLTVTNINTTKNIVNFSNGRIKEHILSNKKKYLTPNYDPIP